MQIRPRSQPVPQRPQNWGVCPLQARAQALSPKPAVTRAGASKGRGAFFDREQVLEKTHQGRRPPAPREREPRSRAGPYWSRAGEGPPGTSLMQTLVTNQFCWSRAINPRGGDDHMWPPHPGARSDSGSRSHWLSFPVPSRAPPSPLWPPVPSALPHVPDTF